jgi:hypothetical protein
MAISSRDAFLREISYAFAREWLLYFHERTNDFREWVLYTCEWVSDTREWGLYTRERVKDTREWIYDTCE